MIENQAYIIALMLLVASPLAIATDEGQAALERFSRTPDDLVYDATNDRTDMLDELDDSILNDVPTDKMNTQDVVEDCYTLEQWKERLGDRDWNKEDWDRESDEVREDEDGARGNSGDKKEKENYNKVTDKVTDKDCFTEVEFEEFVGKMGNKDRVDRDCVTVGQVREKWERIREGARDRDWDRDYDRDDDEDENDRESDDDEGARGVNEEESDEGNDLDDEADEEREELVAVIGELKEACEDGDEAACVELRELLEEYLRGDWEQDEKRDWVQEDRDDSRCVNKHMVNHMKEMADHMKEKFGDRGHKDYDRDRDRDWEQDDDNDEDDENDSEDEEDDSENDEPEEA